MYSIHDRDRFGYYITSDNQKFYNKLECLLHCKNKNANYQWHFNDEYYNCIDWSQEPQASIQDLYVRRAHELRNKYDYLVLHFSGGNDSGNILETFIANNIPLDEIFTRGPYSDTNLDPNDRSAANTFAEIPLHCVPVANYVKEKFQPHLKITVMETKQAVVDLWRQRINWFEMGVNDLDPGQLFRGAPHLIEPRYLRMAEQGKTVGHIFGIDKPKFYVRGRQFFTVFEDLVLNRCVPFVDHNQNSSLIENFYWGPSTGEIVCKQSHLLLNILNRQPDPMAAARRLMMLGTQREAQDWVSSVIYPNRFLPTWNCEKSSRLVLKEWHQWFWADQHSDFLDTWRSHMDSLNSIIPKKWLGGPDIYQSGYKNKYSQGRFIGNLQIS